MDWHTQAAGSACGDTPALHEHHSLLHYASMSRWMAPPQGPAAGSRLLGPAQIFGALAPAQTAASGAENLVPAPNPKPERQHAASRRPGCTPSTRCLTLRAGGNPLLRSPPCRPPQSALTSSKETLGAPGGASIARCLPSAIGCSIHSSWRAQRRGHPQDPGQPQPDPPRR